jgi:hypothetical protein
MAQRQIPISEGAAWRNSANVCALADSDRHLGHVVREGEGWVAYDGTHAARDGNTFRPLGFFPSIFNAKQAVELATKPRAETLIDELEETLV